MKLRIKGNSLRFRVSPSEMRRLLDTGRIEETIYLGSDDGAKLTYALEHTPHVPAAPVRFRHQEITAVVSSQDAQRWAAGQDVGLYGESQSSHGPLQFAVEKDFACLDKSDADNADTFPNPNQGAIC
jgi:hypothetical protein